MPRSQLVPAFEGLNPDEISFSVIGKIDDTDDQPDRVLKLGERVTLIVEAVVVGVNHTMNKDGETTRATKVKVEMAHIHDEAETHIHEEADDPAV